MSRFILVTLLITLVFSGFCLADEAVPEGEGHGESGGGVFTGYLGESIWTIIAFILLLVALRKFAWKPLLAALQAREDHIQKQIDDAEKIKTDAKEVLSQYRDKLSDAERQGKQIIEQHVKQAEKEAKDLEARTRQDIEAMKLRLETEIERSRREAQKELLAQSGQIILNLGKEILGRSISSDDNQRLIEDAINRLEKENENDQKDDGD